MSDLILLLKGVSKNLSQQRAKIQKEYDDYCEKIAQFKTVNPYEKEDLHKILRGFRLRYGQLKRKDQEIKEVGNLILKIRGGKWSV